MEELKKELEKLSKAYVCLLYTSLAYGARESGNQIKPFSTLIFEVELLGIEKDKK